MKKSTRREVAYQTLKVIEDGSYTVGGRTIRVKEHIEASVANSILYRPSDFEGLRQDAKQKLVDGPRFETRISVRNETTLEACERLSKEDSEQDIFVLNFASARNAGGGFLGGAQAQEESLARSSALYPTLTHNEEYYTVNRAQTSLFYTDHMIWSPQVPVFRTDDGTLLEEPYQVTFLTSPAVNAGAVKNNTPELLGEVNDAMRARIQKVLDIALMQKHEVLVLGAWGCGVFRNDPMEIASLFAQHLLEGEYQGAFRHVHFAVLDSKKMNIIEAFEAQLGNNVTTP